MRPPFEKVAIVGVGLIGGSLGLAIRKRKLAKLVMGVVRRRQSGAQALRKKAVHGATMNLKEGVRGADLILLCSPVSATVGQMKQLAKLVEPGALLVDVASTKVLVDRAAKKYLKGVRFAGAHPMAGSAKKGAEHSDADLFEGAVCYMTNFDPEAERFWRALGSKVFYLTPERHDEWVARTSHLPHILAFALFQGDPMKRLQRLGLEASNPSIRDLARLSKSDPKLWADILVSNKEEILDAVREYTVSMSRLKEALDSGNARAVERYIHQANSVSKKLAPKII
jgi:prephenate dehydrogenase